MLPEAGATELIFLAAVALIVVGPKDLPVLMRKVGQWVAKMRGLAAEFRSSFDELARQSELDELRKEVEALRNTRIPDPLTDLNPSYDEASAGLDPSGLSVSHDPHASYQPPAEPLPIEPTPAAESPADKPVMRSRKPKAAAATGDDAEPAPKPKRATKPKAEGTEAVAPKPRARRSSAEAKG